MNRNIYLLVFHGSRDVRSQLGAEKLTDLVRQELSYHQSGVIVEKAFLELTPIPLQEVIINLAERQKKLGASRLYIVPLFLLPGVHVRVDIPEEIKIASYHTNTELYLCNYLGNYGGIVSLISEKFPAGNNRGRILLSHGSRRPEGIEQVNYIAQHLGAVAAYWAVSPGLETAVEMLVNEGKKSIDIVPYFLFEGGIIDGIAEKVKVLHDRYALLELNLCSPLGADVKLARIISEELYGICDRTISPIGSG